MRIFFGQDLQDEQDMAQEENPVIRPKFFLSAISAVSPCEDGGITRKNRFQLPTDAVYLD